MLWLDLFFSFKGRIGRLAFLLCTIAVAIANNIILFVLGINLVRPSLTAPEILLILALCWPMLAVTAKRYHDLGMSGWWMVLPFGAIIMTVVGSGFAAIGASNSSGDMIGLGLILVVASFAALIWAFWHLIKLYFFKGAVGPNTFGSPPRLAHDLLGGGTEPGTAEGSRAMNAIDEHAKAVQASATSITRVARKSPRPAGPAKPAGFGHRGGR